MPAKPRAKVPHGFTLTVREPLPGDGQDITEKLWVELRFNQPPTSEWEAIARGILTRMSCNKPVELHGPCMSHSRELVELLIAEALQSANAVQPQPVSASEKSTKL